MENKLSDLGICSFEQLRIAINDNDREKAIKLLDEVINGVEKFTQKRNCWIDLLFRFIQEKLGDEGVIQVQRAFDKEIVRPHIIPEGVDPEKWSAKDKVLARAQSWMFEHLMTKNMLIEEDEEKFTFKIPCNTGGQLKMTDNYGKTKKSIDSIGVEEGFPLYCLQSILSEAETFRILGYPLWITERKECGEEGCILYIYKNSKKIPSEYKDNFK